MNQVSRKFRCNRSVSFLVIEAQRLRKSGGRIINPSILKVIQCVNVKIICKMQQKQENYIMRNTIITRKRYKFYNNTHNTNFITMQKTQLL